MDRQAGRQRLSIVIPATEVSGLEETLVSVLENRPADCDIIVAHTMRYDDPWNIREEVSFVEPPRGSGLIGCIHAGAAAATGDVIHVLAAGWKATEGWTEPALEHFARGGRGRRRAAGRLGSRSSATRVGGHPALDRGPQRASRAAAHEGRHHDWWAAIGANARGRLLAG